MNIIHPTTVIVAGPTMYGKSQFVVRLIKSTIISPAPEQVIWLYDRYQPENFDSLENSVLFEKVTDIKESISQLEKSLNKNKRTVLILDDQMEEASKSVELSKLFTKWAHHLNMTVIYMIQNLFERGKSHRTASINTH